MNLRTFAVSNRFIMFSLNENNKFMVYGCIRGKDVPQKACAGVIDGLCAHLEGDVAGFGKNVAGFWKNVAGFGRVYGGEGDRSLLILNKL